MVAFRCCSCAFNLGAVLPVCRRFDIRNQVRFNKRPHIVGGIGNDLKCIVTRQIHKILA